ncbi:vacuolar protein sorting-associated protein 13A-like [Tropilaelaps mercedesae]|uniref:Vacuolar protein sorting-associated protein 13A-like n=1 Tax=Tropilaelaps mercedesae TaxID=418985 RepID=A0A1V9Y1H1_9ACAR|nr:vacuolar protein sorting-associated protein 13A-like [Tropilaelaps mercedesae]
MVVGLKFSCLTRFSTYSIFPPVEKLTLKIPWKDLYGSPVVATIDGVYAVVVPSSGTTYDAAKEFRAAQDAKQRALAANEEMKRKAHEMMNPVKREKEDTLVEKIAAQVVKNVQVKISNIHVRYEDSFSNAARPFCFGVTLNRLNFETTDENWQPQMVNRAQHIFHKLVTLDSFSFYWNSRVRLIAHLSPREIMAELIDTIARKNFKPQNIGYMVGPITSVARMKINQKPELNDYLMPSTTVDILVEDISIAMSKYQYHDVMALADSMNRMWLADKFRKYRPSVPLNKNAKKWWKFAYTAILEEQVRPRRQQWNVDYLLGHIRKVKEYRKEYEIKLQTKKESERLKKLEEELDLFNLILARRQAELEVEKLPKPEPKKGWLSGWWGGPSSTEGKSLLNRHVSRASKSNELRRMSYNGAYVPKSQKVKIDGRAPGRIKYFSAPPVRDDSCSRIAQSSSVSRSSKSPMVAQSHLLDPPRKLLRRSKSSGVKVKMRSSQRKHSSRHSSPKRKSPRTNWSSWVFAGKRALGRPSSAGNEIVSSFQKEMTAEEKKKLFAAIDYNENQVPADYPLFFVDKKLNFLLRTLHIIISDDSKMIKEVVMQTTLNEVSSVIEMRPKTDGLKVGAKINAFKIESFPGDEVKRRTLLTSDSCKDFNVDEPPFIKKHLLDVTFEKNPIKGGCDHWVRIFAEPVEAFYDVRSVDAMVDVFKPPETVSIDNIQNTAASSLKSLKVMSATGLQHTIDNKPSLDLLLEVKPSYVLIYEGGRIDNSKNVLVLSMGQLQVKSKPRNKDAPTVREMVKAGSSEKEVLEALFKEAYDKMEFHLSAAELLVVPACEFWYDCVKGTVEGTHILQPTTLFVNVDICFLPDEKRIPKVKVSGQLPALDITLSDEKIVNLLKILMSISGDTKPSPSSTNAKLKDMGQSTVEEGAAVGGAQVVHDRQAQNVVLAQKDKDDQANRSQDIYDKVILDLTFEITSFNCMVNEVLGKRGVTERPLLEFRTNELRTAVILHPLDLSCVMTLKNTALTHLSYKLPNCGKPLAILESSVDPGTGYMLRITYTQAEPKHPEFRNRFKSTLSAVHCTVGEMTFALHREAIISLLGFANSLNEQLGGSQTQPLVSTPAGMDRNGAMLTSVTSQSAVGLLSSGPPARKNLSQSAAPKKPPVVQFSASASLAALKIIFCFTDRLLAHLDVTGVKAGVEQTRRQTLSHVVLKSISMIDANPNTRHPQIISITGDDVLHMRIAMFEESGKEGYTDMAKVDMDIEAMIGQMHFFFLWQFYLDVMSFLDSFQAAKDKMAGATAAAAAAAKGAAELAYAKAYKMALNIMIKAPIIYVPQSSRSQNCLIMDFGVLSIRNTFQPGPTVTSGTPVLYENTKISIDHLKMYRCQLEPMSRECVKNSEFSIMDPVSFSLDVQRNLTAFAHKQLPELRMKGTITSVCFKVSEDDYAALMKTLEQNFAEIPPNYKKADSADQTALTICAQPQGFPVVGSKGVVVADITSRVSKRSAEAIDDEKLVRMEIFFTLQEIKLQLYTRRTIDRCEELSELNIAGFKLCGNFNHDNSFWVNMFLVNLLLEDRRVSRKQGLRRLITKGDESEKMVDIIYQAESTGAFATVAKVSKMRFIYSASLNMALLDLVNQANVNAENEHESAKEEARQKRAVGPIPSGTVQSVQAGATPLPSDPDKKVVPYTVILQIVQPDVLLVADLENPASACIIFKSSVNVKIKQDKVKMNVVAQIQDIEMFVSSLDSGGARSEILRRCNIIAEMDQDSTSMKVKVDVTPIEIHMTPSAVEIVSASLSALSAAPANAELDKPPEFFDPRKIWMPQRFEDLKLWYTQKRTPQGKIEVAQEVQEGVPAVVGEIIEQSASFAMDHVVFTIEQGSGAQTMPMLLVNSSLKGDARNWSSELEFDSVLNCVVFYYNERFAVWEPLLESVETLSGGRKPWEMTMSVRASPAYDLSDKDEPASQLPPLYQVLVCCQETLELTVTKTALQVLQSLGREFSQALRLKEDVVDTRKVDAPYCIKNSLGIGFTVNVEESNFIIVTTEDDFATVNDGKKLHLDFRNRGDSSSLFMDANIEDVNQSRDDKLFFNVRMTFGDTEVERKLNMNHTARRVYRVPFRSYPGDDWSYVVDVSSHYGARLVSLYSIVEVFNAFSVPMEIYYRQGDELILCASVAPKALTHVPLVALYTCKNQLLFKPAGDRYQVASEALSWKGGSGTDRLIACNATTPNRAALYMNVVSQTEELPHEESPSEKCTFYKLRLAPTVMVNNLLPFPVDINLQNTNVHLDLQSGDEVELWNAQRSYSLLNIRMEYAGVKWHSATVIDDTIEELTAITFKDSVDQDNTLDLALHYERKEGSIVLSVHCPFWMVNQTQADIYYKKGKRSKTEAAAAAAGSATSGKIVKKQPWNHRVNECFQANEETICHKADNPDPVLFTFGAKHMFSPKKKMCLRIFDSEWSSKTPLDAVGQSGTLMAKSAKTDQSYPLSVTISLSSTTLTRIVTITPYYMVMNNSKFGVIEIRENGSSGEWLKVEDKQCVPFWPTALGKIELVARYEGTKETTIPFSIKESSSVILRLDNKFGGLFVTSQVEDSATVVSFSEYEPGLSAVLLVNDTDENVFIRQEFTGSSAQCVQVGHSVHYAWEDPTENRQLLCWVREQDVCKVGPLTDATGIIALPENTIYWGSFLDGKQRVLYFSNNAGHFQQIEKVGSLERCMMELEVEFHGMGVSLVDDDPVRREIVYLSVTGSGARWESRVKSKTKYKTLSSELALQFEVEYQKYLNIVKAVGQDAIATTKIGKYRLDFNEMEILAPEPKALRRTNRPGLWLLVRTTENQKALHLKVHRIQTDNQIRDCQFPVILSPVIYKRSVGEQKLAKPFIEMSLIMRQFSGSNLRQIKYCKLLIQEFAIRIDMCFVNSLLAFSTLSQKKTAYAELVERDMDVAKTPLKEIASVHAVQGQRDYIDFLHLSPMKIHLSFSMQAGGSAPPPPEGAFSGLKLLLKSFGFNLADIQGAVLKLDYFERKNDFLTMSQLISDVTNHYQKQALKQFYVVILGLDVMGNPVGLLMGITTGVGDLFYEPLQGAIQGPEEFIAGLAQGVYSLIGHTVGGAADAMGKITGALGKGVAALTMDEDYQKKRRLERNKRPQDITEGIAQSGKDLVMGFYDGVTGVVTKPLEGAREEGITGFMKGMGKGIIGVVARPASGMVDFANGTFASVKRATELEDVAVPVRPPRLIRSGGIVSAYNRMEAEGHQLLQEVENGKYASTDAYVTHLRVCSDGQNFVILTSQRILFVEKGDIFGHWNCEWEYSWDQIRPPVTCTEGVKILLKEAKRKGLFHAKENGKVINLPSTQIAEWLCEQVIRAMNKNA